MDALAWHAAAAAQDLPGPAPLTPLQWSDPPTRRAYAARVAEHLHGLVWPTRDTAAMTRLLDEVLAGNTASPPGAKTIAVVDGPFGIGKSTAVRRWAHDVHRAAVAGAPIGVRGVPECAWDGGVADLVPVVWVNLKSQAQIKDLDTAVLHFLGRPGTGLTRDLTRSLVEAAATHRVRVVVIDDVHMLYTTWKGGRAVLDHVKHLNTELGEVGTSLVLVGADLAGGDVVSDPQIATRLRTATLAPCGAVDDEARAGWQAQLGAAESAVLPHLPAAAPGLLTRHRAAELWARTQGYPADLRTLLAGAVGAAIIDASGTLTVAHLARVPLSARATKAHAALRKAARG